MTKPTKWFVRPAKTQISLDIRSVWSESSLSAWRKLGSLATHWAHSEGSDQTGRMPRLIWVFARRTNHFVVFVMRWLNFILWRQTTAGWALHYKAGTYVNGTGTTLLKRIGKFQRIQHEWTAGIKAQSISRIRTNPSKIITGAIYIVNCKWKTKTTSGKSDAKALTKGVIINIEVFDQNIIMYTNCFKYFRSQQKTREFEVTYMLSGKLWHG